MTRIVALTLIILGLSACAQVNKPITPGDPWREKATSLPSAVPR